jgi:hypothetical protein
MQTQEKSPLHSTDWDTTAARDRRLQQAYQYWDTKRSGRRMPARPDIDPTDIPRLMPFLFLIDVLDPLDFRYRLAGTHFAEWVGINPTGRLIGDVFPPEFASEVHYHWSSCVERKAPKLGIGHLWLPEREFVNWEGVVLPLSPDDGTVTMLLGAVVFTART